MPEQSVIELGFNEPELTAQQKRVVKLLTEIYDLSKKLDGLKISPLNMEGLSDLNKVVKEQSQVLQKANKAFQDYEKQRILSARAAEAEAKARLAEAKALDAETKAQERLNKTKQQEPADIPFTSNVKPDGTLQGSDSNFGSGSVVSNAELANTEAQLQAMQELNAVKAESVKIDQNATAEQQQYVQVLAEQNQAIDANITELESYAQIIAENNKTLAKIAPATEEFVGSLNNNQTALANIKQDLVNNKASQAALNAEMQQSAVITAEQEAQMNALKAEEIQLNKESTTLTATIKMQIKEMQAESGSIEQLRARLTNLQNAYERMGEAQRSSTKGLALKAQIDQLEPAVKKAEGSIGRFSRNVGNYAGGIEKAFKGAFGFLRTAANIIPGLGISGIILAAGNIISEFVEKISSASKEMLSLKDAAKQVNDAIGTTNTAYGETTVKINDLINKIELAKKGQLDGKQVLDEYNKSIGETAGNAKSLSEAEQLLIDKGPAVIQLTLLKAKAAAAGALATKAANDAVNNEGKNLEEYVDKFDIAWSGIKSFFTGGANDIGDLAANAIKDAAKEQKDAIKTSESSFKTFTDLQKKYTDEAAKFAKENKLNFNPVKFDANKTKKEADEFFNKLKEGIQAQIEALQHIVNNDDLTAYYSFEERYKAAVKINLLEQNLSEATLRHDIKTGKDRITAAQEQSNRLIDITKKTYDNISKVRAEAYRKYPPIPEPEKDTSLQKQLEARKKVNDQINSIVEAAGKDRANIIAKEYADEQRISDEAYANGLIGRTEYERQTRDITLKYSQQALEAAIQNKESLEKLIPDKNSDAYRAAEAEIAKLRQELAKLKGQAKDNGLEDFASDLEKVAGAAANLGEAFSNIASISFENQKNKLEEIGAQEEKNYEAQVANINNSTLAEEQKADQLKILDSQHAARQEELARRQREIDNRKARFDKAVSIMNIILGTAAAVAKATTIFEKIAFAALGAAQLAAAVAVQVPQYGEGIMNVQKEHEAIVGEKKVGGKYQPELVQRPGHEDFITDRPMLVKLPKHSNVIPLKDGIVNMATRSALRGLVINMSTENTSGDNSWEIARWQMKEYRKIHRPVRQRRGYNMNDALYIAKNIKHTA